MEIDRQTWCRHGNHHTQSHAVHRYGGSIRGRRERGWQIQEKRSGGSFRWRCLRTTPRDGTTIRKPTSW